MILFSQIAGDLVRARCGFFGFILATIGFVSSFLWQGSFELAMSVAAAFFRQCLSSRWDVYRHPSGVNDKETTVGGPGGEPREHTGGRTPGH